MPAAFHEIRFPLRLSLQASGGPMRRTDILDLSSGRESRNARWSRSRRSYDAGCGIRSLADLYEVLAFFEARAGALHGFRFRDPFDASSARPGTPLSPHDQPLGTGDGQTATFQLVKLYADAGGESRRLIEKPVASSLRLAANGSEVPPAAFTLEASSGKLVFAATAIPAPGVVLTVGYEFDVPVRFATDRIEASLAAVNAGRIPSIPLVEIRP